MLADAVIHIAPLAILGRENAQIGGLGVVRTGQVSRPAYGFKHHGVHCGQNLFAGRTGGEFGLGLNGGFFHFCDGFFQALGCVTCKDARNKVLAALGQGGKMRLPCGTGGSTACAEAFPTGFDVCGNAKGRFCPAIGGFGVGDQLGVGQSAVACGCVLRRRAKGDMGLAGDQSRCACGLGLG